jgi:hypothetical protein
MVVWNDPRTSHRVPDGALVGSDGVRHVHARRHPVMMDLTFLVLPIMFALFAALVHIEIRDL